jgi:hypothetical protein
MTDGRLRERGRFPLPGEGGTLVMSSVETYDAASSLVNGTQVYEIYDSRHAVQDRRELPLRFYVHTPIAFQRLVEETGYRVMALYGDYCWSGFNAEASPFMIWVLQP